MQAWKLGPALAGGNTVVMKVRIMLHVPILGGWGFTGLPETET